MFGGGRERSEEANSRNRGGAAPYPRTAFSTSGHTAGSTSYGA